MGQETITKTTCLETKLHLTLLKTPSGQVVSMFSFIFFSYPTMAQTRNLLQGKVVLLLSLWCRENFARQWAGSANIYESVELEHVKLSTLMLP